VTLHEVHITTSNLRDKVLRWIERAISKRAHAIVHTPKQQAALNKAACIHMGLDLKPLHARRGRNVLLFGILSKNKGADYAIKAVHNSEFSLEIMGSVPDKKYQEELEDAIAQSPNIKAHLGWVSDEEKWQAFERADIVVMPYLWAPYQSAVLHNALSYGLPVVVSNVDSLPEMVRQFALGRVVVPRDSAAILSALRDVYAHYESYQEHIKRYRNEANWETVRKKHLDFYLTVLDSQ